MASTTRADVAVETPYSELITRDTVLMLTPASAATSRIVGLRLMAIVSGSVSDNVVGPDGITRRRALSSLTRLDRCLHRAHHADGACRRLARERCRRQGVRAVPERGDECGREGVSRTGGVDFVRLRDPDGHRIAAGGTTEEERAVPSAGLADHRAVICEILGIETEGRQLALRGEQHVGRAREASRALT